MLPTHVDRYRVERLLGEGATSKVYLATDPKLDRQVAVKVLAEGADEDLRARFQREARAIAACKHPNIVGILDYSGEADATLYLVLEYVPARSLYQWTHEHGALTEATALCVGHEIALALEHLHAATIVHRDLKPENVLLQEGRVVLTDFGGIKILGRQGGSGVNQTAVLGTPGFMAPEQFAGSGIDPRTDLFSFGATLYNLVTGRIPYDGGSVQKTYDNLKRGQYVDARAHHALLSEEFARFLAKCLAPRPEDRFDSATAVRQATSELLELHGVAEVRQELTSYTKAPKAQAVSQRERAVDHLHDKLRAALRDQDVDGAHHLVERIRHLAPVDERIERVKGMGGARILGMTSAKQAQRRGLWQGLVLGVVVGAAAMAAVLSFV